MLFTRIYRRRALRRFFAKIRFPRNKKSRKNTHAGACGNKIRYYRNRRQAEIERLAYSRKTEIDPDDYEMFKIGLKELTKTEKTVFDLYLQGKTAKEIADMLDIRESTLKFHNHNILEKLGVSSRKQMLRYATLLKQETQN